MSARSSAIVVAFIVGLVVGALLAFYFLKGGLSLTTPTTATVQPSTSGGVAGCNLVVLPDEEYYPAVLNLVKNARSSIYVVMYAVKYDPREPDDPVTQLLTYIVEKSRSGLDVKIVVDDVTYNDYPETIDFLLSSNVSLKLDESRGRTTHTKLVIVDNSTAVLGSHNWTESALTRNRELSILIGCRDVVRELLKYFDDIWMNGRSIS